MSPDFLSRFETLDQNILDGMGETIHLTDGQFLLRRGDQSRDVYRIERGTLEVTDTRFHPGIILKVLSPGEVVGEIGFVAGTPRSADVIAASGCVVRRWPAELLDQLIESDPSFSARFWKAIAVEVAGRLQGANTVSVSTSVFSGATDDPSGDGAMTALVRDLARSCREGLASLDVQLRRDAQDVRAKEQLANLLDDLLGGMERLSAECGESRKILASAAMAISSELLPYFRQATTARLAIDHRERVGGPDVMAHIIRNQAEGESPLGLCIDQWLLDLPFPRGLRSRQQSAFEEIQRALPPTDPVRVLLLHAGVEWLCGQVHALLSRRQGTLVIVEDRRESLEKISQDLPLVGSPLRVQFVLDPLNELPFGSSLRAFRDQNVILVDALLDYLPARIATEALGQLSALLAARGQLIATALSASNDRILWQHMLAWPAIHRPPRSLTDIVHAAGFGTVSLSLTSGAGSIVVARDVASSGR
jgi:CRP-like cAMP-binding protein